MVSTHRQVILAARPSGLPSLSDFELVSSPVPTAGPGECLVREIYLSIDPYMRGRMDDRKSYAAAVQLGQVMVGQAVGRIVTSHHPGFRAGDLVIGDLGWQEQAAVSGDALAKIDSGFGPASTALGILGMTGLTAYFGLLNVGRPREGETVVVSGAAGAVGSTVGQIAKIRGCRVVGLTSSHRKVQYLTTEMGFDAALDCGSGRPYLDGLTALCPDGVDIYFDNVGGDLTDNVISLLNVKGRVAICGQSSQYNLERQEYGPRWLRNLIIKRARVEGFLVWDFIAEHADALRQLAEWLKADKLRNQEYVVRGIENAPSAFIDMLQGHHMGKHLVKLSPG